MCLHADGPTKDSQSSYAAASAGVAVSKTPYGPFRFIERYRLNTCPADQEDMYPQSKGMARDMNLFTDDDGTAYIIYSSEENLTLNISRLNDSYTREAPALFKGDGVYLLSDDLRLHRVGTESGKILSCSFCIGRMGELRRSLYRRYETDNL